MYTKSKIVSIPIGILSSRLKLVVVTKKIWNAMKKTDATGIRNLKTLLRILYQKIKVKNEYSKKV